MDLNTQIGILAFFIFLTVMFTAYAIYAPIVNVKKDDEVGTDIVGLGTSMDIDPNDSLGRYVRPILDNFMPQLPIKLSEERSSGLEKIIRTSGNPWKINAQELVALQIALGILGVLVGTGISLLPWLPEELPKIIIPVFFGAALAALPFSRHNSLRQERVSKLEKELPEALDLLTITLKSGQSFETALESVARQLPEGLLKNELIQVVTELSAGQTQRHTLTRLYYRFDSEDLESFCKAVIQSTDLGSSLEETLEQQAEFIRANYEARLERMISRLETTMFIPLIITMLPAFLIIFVAPTLSQIMEYMG